MPAPARPHARRTADLVAGLGGVTTTAALRRYGIGRRQLEAALADGSVIRVRRGWFAIPAADPSTVAAARAGVVLTCVTLARRLGLWVLDDAGAPHVAAPPHAGRVATESAVVHWSRPAVPRHPDQVEDHLENALVLVAHCRPPEESLVIWESALRKGLVEKAVLARLPLTATARDVLDRASLWSDSGLETLAVPRLRWLGLPLRQQIWILGHRVDLLIGDRLVLQIDGGTHVGAQRDADNAHDAALMLRGYHVIRVGYDAVVNRWPEVQELVMRAVAQGLHRAS